MYPHGGNPAQPALSPGLMGEMKLTATPGRVPVCPFLCVHSLYFWACILLDTPVCILTSPLHLIANASLCVPVRISICVCSSLYVPVSECVPACTSLSIHQSIPLRKVCVSKVGSLRTCVHGPYGAVPVSGCTL